MTSTLSKVDRYGFVVCEKEGVSVSEKRLLAKESEQEAMREQKWQRMIKHENGRFVITKGRGKLESRIRKGIPDAYRSVAWRIVIDPESAKDSVRLNREKVGSLVLQGSEDRVVHQICLDVSRTLPGVPAFAESLMQDRLKMVLIAYANVDPDLGYTQSMAFIAATFLLYMDVQDSFYCFRSLMLADRYRYREFYTDGFPKLYQLKKVWDVLLHDKERVVSEFLEKNGIMFENYGMGWFLCAFMDIDFVPVLKMRIFERYLAFGCRALLTFGVAVLSRMREKMLKSELDDVMGILRRPGVLPELMEWRKVIEKWDKVWISEKEYARYFARVGLAVFY
jgi:hypothetical protein